ncbi:MAG: hypothetical protein ABI852_05870, partial [Gemmatimonadaceae bacterium]
ISKGILVTERKLVVAREYRAENKSDKDKTLLIEHPSLARSGYKLVDTQKPVETTDAFYRFEGKVSAHKTSVLKVREEMVQSQSVSIAPADIGTLYTYARNGEVPAEVRESLNNIIMLKQAMIETERQFVDRNRQATEISVEQNRLRENMKTVAQNSDYYKRLLQKLNDQETQLEKLGRERDELQAKRASQGAELDAFLSTLTIG